MDLKEALRVLGLDETADQVAVNCLEEDNGKLIPLSVWTVPPSDQPTTTAKFAYAEEMPTHKEALKAMEYLVSKNACIFNTDRETARIMNPFTL